jgi:predicted enzyme related to lactoylglutathione lyase
MTDSHIEEGRMISHVSVVTVYVNDQERARAFYTDKLGFEVRRDDPMSETARWLEVAPKGLHSPRVVVYKAEGQWEGRAGGFSSFVFATPDVNATYQELSGRGVEFTAPPKQEPWGMWAQFKDQDGNEFGLFEEPAP